MRIVVALGGSAFANPTAVTAQPATAQRASIRAAAVTLAGVAARHQLVVCHGTGPQAGLLALQSAAIEGADPDPADLLGALTDATISYLLEQELANQLPYDMPIATILPMVEIDRRDPSFDDPGRFIGRTYTAMEAGRLSESAGWTFKPDPEPDPEHAEGRRWRRVVPSPEPRRVFELRPIRWLLDRNVVLMCAGGGGIPVRHPAADYSSIGSVQSIADTVIDATLVSELLAREVEADLLVLATNTDGVYSGWGTPQQRRLGTVTAGQLRQLAYSADPVGHGPNGSGNTNRPPETLESMVLAAIRFTEHTGNRAAIGNLADLDKLVDGVAGTQVVPTRPTRRISRIS